MLSQPDAVREWSRRHGYDATQSMAVMSWLHVVHAIATPLAAREVSPDAVTSAAVACAVAAVWCPGPVAPAAVLASVVLDGVDGAVAVRRPEATRHGTALDHAADRVADVCFARALRRAGAAPWSARAATVLPLCFEGARGVVRLRHASQSTAVTVGDRPFRVVATLVGLVAAPTTGAAVVGVLSAIGIGQLIARPGQHEH